MSLVNPRGAYWRTSCDALRDSRRDPGRGREAGPKCRCRSRRADTGQVVRRVVLQRTRGREARSVGSAGSADQHRVPRCPLPRCSREQ
jgi:hypothetical protein